MIAHISPRDPPINKLGLIGWFIWGQHYPKQWNESKGRRSALVANLHLSGCLMVAHKTFELRATTAVQTRLANDHDHLLCL